MIVKTLFNDTGEEKRFGTRISLDALIIATNVNTHEYAIIGFGGHVDIRRVFLESNPGINRRLVANFNNVDITLANGVDARIIDRTM